MNEKQIKWIQDAMTMIAYFSFSVHRSETPSGVKIILEDGEAILKESSKESVLIK